MEKKHLATISILVKDRHTHAKDLNAMLSENGHLIMARLGLNVQKSCIANCTAMITIAVEASIPEIKKLTKEIDELYGIVAKASILTE